MANLACPHFYLWCLDPVDLTVDGIEAGTARSAEVPATSDSCDCGEHRPDVPGRSSPWCERRGSLSIARAQDADGVDPYSQCCCGARGCQWCDARAIMGAIREQDDDARRPLGITEACDRR